MTGGVDRVPGVVPRPVDVGESFVWSARVWVRDRPVQTEVFWETVAFPSFEVWLGGLLDVCAAEGLVPDVSALLRDLGSPTGSRADFR